MTSTRQSIRVLLASALAVVLGLGMFAAPAQAAAKRSTTVSLSATKSVSYNGKATLRGTVKYKGSKSVVKGAKVRIQRKSGSKWRTITTVKANKKGKFTYVVRGLKSTTSYRAVVKKGKKYKASKSKVRKVKVAKKPKTKVTKPKAPAAQTISVTTKSPSSFTVGDTVTVKGKGSSGLSSKPLTLQRSHNGNWVDVKTATTKANGTYTISAAVYGLPGAKKSFRVVAKTGTKVAVASPTWTSNVYGWFYLANSSVAASSTSAATSAVIGSTVKINGKTYGASIYSKSHLDTPVWLEYKVSKSCTAFRSDIGIGDDTAVGSKGRFELFKDGKKAGSAVTKKTGDKTSSFTASVSGAAKLKLQTANLSPGSNVYSAWANPQVRCLSQPSPR